MVVLSAGTAGHSTKRDIRADAGDLKRDHPIYLRHPGALRVGPPSTYSMVRVMNHYIVDRENLRRNGRVMSEVDTTVYLEADFDAQRLRADTAEAELKKLCSEHFKEAVACVFDNLKMVACNTDDRAWDERLEDLAEDVIEMSPDYKKEWKDIGVLCAKLAAAEQRIAELSADNQHLRKLLEQTLAALNPTAKLSKSIRAALNQKSEGESQ